MKKKYIIMGLLGLNISATLALIFIIFQSQVEMQTQCKNYFDITQKIEKKLR
jgi:hypothetical protein